MSPHLPALSSIPPDIVSSGDYERRAPDHMDAKTWAYLSGGAGDETTLADNILAFSRVRLLPRVLAPVSGGHTRLTLAGLHLAHPFLLAPVGWQRLFHPQGELAAAQAAGVMETPFIVSTFATTPIEDVVAASAAPVWFQIYFQPSQDLTLQLLKRAEAAGCQAFVVTVDAPVSGVRNREQRAGHVIPEGLLAPNVPRSSSTSQPATASGSRVFDNIMLTAPGWADVEWLTQQTRLPVFIKGILHPDDADRALNCGAAGIVVSNHGGRVLDGTVAALDALPAVADRVSGRGPILFDSGIRRGSDAFKAIALGAQAVLVGRPYIYALSVAGPLGVAHLLRTLREELEITMALMGCADLTDINAGQILRGTIS